jgi:hypothetical protein
MWLNFALSVLALGSTLSAFGGETWRKGEAAFIARVTWRGWLSLFFLLAAFGLGTLKEVRSDNAKAAADIQQKEMQRRLMQTQAALEMNLNSLSDEKFMLVEARFQSLSDISRQVFHGLTYLSAAPHQPVIDDMGEPLVIFAGDHIEAVQDTSPGALVALRIGEELYQLEAPGAFGIKATAFAAKGRHSEPMAVSVDNIDKVKGSIKWFVTSNATVRQDAEFKKLLARTEIPDKMKAMFQIVGVSGAVINAAPRADARVIERPDSGFLVKRIIKTPAWSEVQMPGGRTGWIRNEALQPLL